MPKIRIFEQDNTGADYAGGETVVFVPGPVEIQTDSNGKSLADDNSCVYISTTNYNNINKFLNTTIGSGDSLSKLDELKLKTIAFIQTCLSHNMDVIYCYIKDFGTPIHVGSIPKGTYESEGRDAAIAALPTVTVIFPGSLSTALDEGQENYIISYNTDSSFFNFLQDKDNYNIKFLTTGCINAISCVLEPDQILQDSSNTVNAKFDFSIVNILNQIAFDRKDCVVLLSVDYDTDKVKNGNVFAGQLSNAINAGSNNVQQGKELVTTEGQESYGAIFLPNLTATLNVESHTISTTMPSVWGYLADYGTCLGNGQEWLPIANSTRGSVESLGTPDLTVTKYYMDNEIIKDENGSSFNGIVNLRPYGSVIWGDRTLLKLTTSVKATAYLSLRALVCDIAKRAYQSAIKNTYESNNDVTWFNFKTRIVDLLGEMVAAGVLSNYSITKQSPTSISGDNKPVSLNTIICKITIYPNLPVENFDIYINLENAEINATAGNA